jgi:hypothetical protein
MSTNSVDLLTESDLGQVLLRAARGPRFGSVEIAVHDGSVVRIERRERIRLDATHPRSPDLREPGRSPEDGHHRKSGAAASAGTEKRLEQ